MNERDRYTCEQVFLRLEDYLDRELAPQETELVKEHLEICAWCASTYAFQAEVLDSLKQKIQRVEVPSSLRSKVLSAIRQEAEE